MVLPQQHETRFISDQHAVNSKPRCPKITCSSDHFAIIEFPVPDPFVADYPTPVTAEPGILRLEEKLSEELWPSSLEWQW